MVIKLRKIHRWVSIFVVVYVLMACISGAIHIVMSNFFSPPPAPLPVALGDLSAVTATPAQVVAKLPNPAEARSVNLRRIGNTIYYQVLTQKGTARYFDISSGERIEGLDPVYAKQIAAAHLKIDQNSMQQLDYLTRFDSEYLNIFRVLPVYHFAHPETGQRVYVSTATGSVTLYLNPIRAAAQKSFSVLHKLSFISHKPTRDVFQGLLLLAIVGTSLMGTVIFFRKGRV